MQTKEEMLIKYKETMREARKEGMPVEGLITLIQPFYLDTLLSIRDALFQACTELTKMNHPLMALEEVPKPEEEDQILFHIKRRYADIICDLHIWVDEGKIDSSIPLKQWGGEAYFSNIESYEKAVLASGLEDSKVPIHGTYKGIPVFGDVFKQTWSKEKLKIEFIGTGELKHE